MSELLHTLSLYLSYDFVRYALITGVLVALCASLLGVSLVLRRFAFMGDGLSHAAFGAMAVAAVIGLSDEMLLVLPVTILFAVLLLRKGERARVQGDAALAMLSAGAMAFGYLLLHLFSPSANIAGDVCSTLFGSTSILTLSARDVWISFIMSAAVVLVTLLFHHQIFALTFDETFARATGLPAGRYNLLLAIITAVTIVLTMRLVGALLTSALIVFPALSAMRLCRSFRGVLTASALLSILSALVGILLSMLAGTPTGATIVLTELFCFVICSLLHRLRRQA